MSLIEDIAKLPRGNKRGMGAKLYTTVAIDVELGNKLREIAFRNNAKVGEIAGYAIKRMLAELNSNTLSDTIPRSGQAA